MPEPAKNPSNNVATIPNKVPELKVIIQMYPLDLIRDEFTKKGTSDKYYKQPASISQGEGLPPIPHSFYVKNSDDSYEPGKYVADIVIKPGKFGAEFDLAKPRLMKEPK